MTGNYTVTQISNMKSRILVALVIAFFTSGLSAASLWTCNAKLNARRLEPDNRQITIDASGEFEFLDDGTMQYNNHINQDWLPGTYYTHGKKIYAYPDYQAAINAAESNNPGISDMHVISDYLVFSLNKKIEHAGKATWKGHLDEQFYTENGVFVRVVGNSTGHCVRLR